MKLELKRIGIELEGWEMEGRDSERIDHLEKKK